CCHVPFIRTDPPRATILPYTTLFRSQAQQSAKTLAVTNIPYVTTNDEQRYEGKLTYTPRPGHSLESSFTKINQVLKNNTGSTVKIGRDTSELQSHLNLVCRLLLEKKN